MLFIVGLFGIGFFWPIKVLAVNAEYRRCEENSTCTIGEFLYDDNYVPITSASCKLTSRNGSGVIVLNSINLAVGSDGWYSHDFPTATLSAGLYRSNICCTNGAEYLCLDKSFIVGASFTTKEAVADAVWDEARSGHNTAGSFGENLQNPSSVSVAEIWSYPTRSLTSFGTLVADIWSYATRTVSGVGSTAADIWSYATRTLTGASLSSGSLSTQSDVKAASDKIDESREELEKLVNRPTITNFVEENKETTSLDSKLLKTREVVNQIYNDTQNLKLGLSTLVASWDKQSTNGKRASLATFSKVLGASTESPNTSSLRGQIDWLVAAWNAPLISELRSERERVMAITKSVNLKLNTSGQAANVISELDTGYESLSVLETIIGSYSDALEQNTLFGLIKQLEQTAGLFDQYDQELNRIVLRLGTYTSNSLMVALDEITEKVLQINQVPEALIILDGAQSKAHPENRAFALKAIISANQTILARLADEPTTKIWLENGSVIFKSLITNPSTNIRQKIPIKYLLPKEVGLEDIIQLDSRLTCTYDADEESLVCEGSVELGPQESRVLAIEVEDVWKIPQEQIAALRKQNETLFQPLKNTAYFAQAATLKADIEVSLDKIVALQDDAKNPEARIQAYRESLLELNGVQSKLESMKSLVASAGSVGTIFGFVGGVQTIAVWGLILVLVTGFIFLALAMRSLTRRKEVLPKVIKTSPVVHVVANEKIVGSSTIVIHLPKRRSWMIATIGLALLTIILLFRILTSSSQQRSNLLMPVPSVKPLPTIIITPGLGPSPIATVSGQRNSLDQTILLNQEKQVLGTQAMDDEVMIVVPDGVPAVNIRLKPIPGSDIVKDVVQDTLAKKTGMKNGWVGVRFMTKNGREIIGWVDGQYIKIPGEQL